MFEAMNTAAGCARPSSPARTTVRCAVIAVFDPAIYGSYAETVV